MKRNILLAIASIAALSIGTVMFLSEDDVQDEDAQYSTETTQNETTPALISRVTQGQLTSGIRAKQAAFEAAEPEYPDTERIIYEIAEGEFEPELHPADAELWDIVSTLAPNQSTRDSVVEFVVYYDTEDTSLASVAAVDDDNDEWSFEINYIAVEDFEDLIPTIIHEYAHILSLNNAETISLAENSRADVDCPTIYLAEGCLGADSYLAGFYGTFWKDTPNYIGDRDRTEDETIAFYDANPDSFVSEYATTNVVEDFAESFMFYIIKEPQPSETVALQKTSFFEQFSELDVYRNTVRSTIASW